MNAAQRDLENEDDARRFWGIVNALVAAKEYRVARALVRAGNSVLSAQHKLSGEAVAIALAQISRQAKHRPRVPAPPRST